MDPGLWWHNREYGLIPALRVTAVYRRSLNPSYTSRAIGEPSVTIPIYMKLNHFAGHLKLTQHCELTSHQLKTYTKKGKSILKIKELLHTKKHMDNISTPFYP